MRQLSADKEAPGAMETLTVLTDAEGITLGHAKNDVGTCSTRWRLKPGYRENLSRKTWEGDAPGSYWHAERAALAPHYQFDVYLLARELARQQGATSVLDVGCGPAIKAASLLCDVVPEVVLIDQPTTAPLAAKNCPRATFVAADLERIDFFWPRTFDIIICADVIEHLLDPSSCLQFIHRHAGPNTSIVISTPERDYCRGVPCMACDKPEHVREWNGSEFAALLADYGLHVHRHTLAPTLRPERDRGDVSRSWLTPFVARPHMEGDLPDRMRSCQVCECRLSPVREDEA